MAITVFFILATLSRYRIRTQPRLISFECGVSLHIHLLHIESWTDKKSFNHKT
jgi:hypothetical protein